MNEVKNIPEMMRGFDETIFSINNANLRNGFKIFVKKLKEKNKELVTKDYFYVNIWSIICKPCSDEMPFLNSLPCRFQKDITYVMVSSHSDEAVNNFLKNKGIEMKNFTFVNEMIDFISGIYCQRENLLLCRSRDSKNKNNGKNSKRFIL